MRGVWGGGRLWSRHGKQLHVPEVVAAAGTLGGGVVVDGELVVVDAGGCDFAAMCRRLHTPAPPGVTFVVFDLLAADGTDLRPRPYRHRRQRLRDLLTDADPRLQLMPATTDRAEAAHWYASPLVEGLVVKPLDSAYPRMRDQRGWQKLRRRHTITVLAVGVQGPPAAPQRLVLGGYLGTRLRIVGATLPLAAAQRSALPRLDVRDGVRAVPGWMLGGLPGRTDDSACYLPVHPVCVDVAADTAVDGGHRLRHCPPLVRPRPDLDPASVTLPLPAA